MEGGREDLGRLPEAEINNVLFSAVWDIFDPMNVYRTLITGCVGGGWLVCDVQHVCLVTKGTRIIQCDWSFKLFP